MLKIAATINFLLAAGHLLCLLWLDAAFRIYRVDALMARIAADYGAALPVLLTLTVALGLVVCGLYALSADGVIGRLPLLHTVVYATGIAFALRALAGVAKIGLVGWYFPEVISIAITTVIGVLYLAGGHRAFRAAARRTTASQQ